MSTTTTTSPVLPVIEISPASPEEPQPEPYSPFTPLTPGCSRPMDDTYRSSLLTPPVQSWSLSPLRPLSERRPKLMGQGLKDDQFQALLRASKERSASAASKKQQYDLRKEVALKAHKNKQLERRALFLSKIGAPPSPTATSLPKTPPDSPAIFHYSLPSPGLCSPLALFEKLGLDDQDLEERGVRRVWVEQVDFRLPKQQEKQPRPDPEDVPEDVPASVRVEMPSITLTTPEEEHDQSRTPQQRGHARKRSIPSLEQITERYSAQVDTAAPTPTRPRAPLPAFLNARRQSPSPPLPTEVPMVMVTAPAESPRPRLACTGRIRLPSRSPSPPSDSDSSVATSKPLPTLPSEAELPQRRMHPLPLTPLTPPCLPALEIRTTHVPRTESTSPVHSRLTEANLLALNSRTSTAREMLSTIRRRTTVISCGNGRMQMYPPTPGTPPPAWRSSWQVEDEKQRRRHSAPADLPKAGRVGFMHPVLALPGGF